VIAGETVHVFRENISLECVNVVLVAVLGRGGGGGRREGEEARDNWWKKGLWRKP
jgi:hypothetical protein